MIGPDGLAPPVPPLLPGEPPLAILVDYDGTIALTDVSDTAGVMLFFPFSTQNLSIQMWKHAASQGRLGDAAAYYSGLGGVWDFFWFCMVLVFARKVFRADYFWSVVVPADFKVWSWARRRLHLTDNGMLLAYRAYFLYGMSRR